MAEPPSGRLAGKVAVVTGGANGIGEAAVHRFLAEGASVLLADLDEENGDRVAAVAVARGHGDRVRALRCDVSDEADVAAAVAAAVDAFGRLDCMYSNAGTSVPDSPLVDQDVEAWDRIVGINLNSVLFGIKHGARAIRAHGDGGTIINTASLAALTARSGPPSYSAAKAAIVNLTMSAAVQLASDRIRVNCISPGSILTSLVVKLRGAPEAVIPVMERSQPWPEHGTPDDIAAAAVFLASDDSRFVSGHNLVVDGGLTAAGPRFLDRIREIQAEIDREPT